MTEIYPGPKGLDRQSTDMCEQVPVEISARDHLLHGLADGRIG